MEQVWKVVSSNGELTVSMNGNVHTVYVYPEGDSHLMDIVRMDMAEWKKHYKQQIQANDSIDILTIGYWYIDRRKGSQELYEPPIEDYRNEIEGKFVMG